MKILIADDNRFYRRALETTIAGWGYEVVGAANGVEAWQVLQQKDGPKLAIIDWLMPGLDGVEVCRRVRAQKKPNPPYLIILTAKGGKEDVVTALQEGADDYISKPFELQELRARLQVGVRIAGLQSSLAERVSALEVALSEAQRVEALGRLAGGVAHDFNNLLTVINGYSDLLLSGAALGPRDRDWIEVIKQAGERGAGLTRQLLAFARRQVLNPVVLNLNGCVQNVQRMMAPLLGQGVELVTELETGLHPVEADATQLEQVLVNLLLNARDAMPGGGRITVTTGNRDVADGAAGPPDVAPGSYAVLTVADTGCGMDDATRARIFEPFFTTKAVGKGTGLGLATAYGIVRQSGGSIAVDSTPGQGTTFTIYLPRAAAGAPAPAPRVETPGEGGGETVLVVEDEDRVRELIDSILTLHGYTVLQAANGRDALRVADRYADPIHLLLADMVMPEMTGGQLAADLLPVRPGLRVLYMSGYTDAAMPHAGAAAGFPFLLKPFTADVLVSKVREVLASPQAGPGGLPPTGERPGPSPGGLGNSLPPHLSPHS